VEWSELSPLAPTSIIVSSTCLAWSVIIIKVQLNSQMLIRLGDLMEILLPWSFSSAIAVLGVGSCNLSPSLKISSCQEPHPPLPFYQNGFAMAIIMGRCVIKQTPQGVVFPGGIQAKPALGCLHL